MPEFSPAAIEALYFAREEAELLHTPCLGTEHLLLGMLRRSQAQEVRVFQLMDLDLIRARTVIARLSGRGEPLFSAEQTTCLTSEVRRIWHNAADEAKKMQQQVEIRHLLLALILQPDSKAYQVLRWLDVNPEELRPQILQALFSGEDSISTPLSSEQKPRETFNKFTQRARLSLNRTQEEATILQQTYIDLEHLFLGLLCAGEGVALRVLTMSGVNLDVLEQTFVRQLCPRKSGGAGLTARATRVIQLAVDEAFRFGHHYLGTEHLLLGMLRESEGPKETMLTRLGLKRRDELRAENLFVSAGLNVEDLRNKTLLVLASGASDDQV